MGFFKLFAEGKISFTSFVAAVPNERPSSTNDFTYRVRYFAKMKSGVLAGVILTLVDVTKELRAENSAKAAKQRANFILAVSENRANFIRFIADVENLFARLKVWSGEPFKVMRLQTHTLKGAAGMFEMPQLAARIHEFENKVKTLSESDASTVAIVNKEADQILDLFASLLKSEHRLLERLRIVGVRETTLTDAHAQLVRRVFVDPINTGVQFETALTYLRAPSLNALLQGYVRHVDGLSAKLAKKVTLDIAPPNFDALVLSERFFQTVNALVHLFNNAVDHGIEDQTSRAFAAKPEVGTIRLSTTAFDQSIVIRIEDDGTGLDPAQLREAMVRRGIATKGKSDREVLQVIFDAGFSTKARATTISGQGVGLSALFECVSAMGGEIEVLSKLGAGTSFEVRIPTNGEDLKAISLSASNLARHSAAS